MMEIGWAIDKGFALCAAAYKLHEAMTDDILSAPEQFRNLAREVENFYKVFKDLLEILEQHKWPMMISCTSIEFTLKKCRLFLDRFWKLSDASTGSGRERFNRSLVRAARWTFIAQPAADRLRMELASHIRILTLYTNNVNCRIALEERAANREFQRRNLELLKHLSPGGTQLTKQQNVSRFDEMPGLSHVPNFSDSEESVHRSNRLTELEYARKELEDLRTCLDSEERKFHDPPNSLHDFGHSPTVENLGHTDAADFIHLAREDIESRKERIRDWEKWLTGTLVRSDPRDSGIAGLGSNASPAIDPIEDYVGCSSSQSSPIISSVSETRNRSASNQPPSPSFLGHVRAQGLGVDFESYSWEIQAPPQAHSGVTPRRSSRTSSRISSRGLIPTSTTSQKMLSAYENQLRQLELTGNTWKHVASGNTWKHIASGVTISIERNKDLIEILRGNLLLSQDGSRTKVRLTGETNPTDEDDAPPPLYFQQVFSSSEPFPYPHIFHTGADPNRRHVVRMIGGVHELRHLDNEVLPIESDLAIYYDFHEEGASRMFQEQIYGRKLKCRFDIDVVESDAAKNPVNSTTLQVWEDCGSHIRSLTVFGRLVGSESLVFFAKQFPALKKNKKGGSKIVRLSVRAPNKQPSPCQPSSQQPSPVIDPDRRRSSASSAAVKFGSSTLVQYEMLAEPIKWIQFQFKDEEDKSEFLALWDGTS